MGQISFDFISADFLFKSFISILLAFVLWGVLALILRVMHKNIGDVQLYHKVKKTLKFITFVIFVVIIMGYMFAGDLASMTTFLGLLSAGIAIALKDFVVNIVAWFFIVIRKPFRVGDRIQTGDIAGDVIDLRIFQFTLMEIGNWVDGDQSTGRVIHIPNSKVLIEPLANFSQGFQYIWNEISVLITFESDWKKAKQILNDIVNKHSEHLSKEAEDFVRKASKRYMIYYSKLTPIVYTSVVDSGVKLTIRYLCKPRRRRKTVEEIWEAILEEFEKYKDIELAYPTQRIVFNNNDNLQ